MKFINEKQEKHYTHLKKMHEQHPKLFGDPNDWLKRNTEIVLHQNKLDEKQNIKRRCKQKYRVYK